MYAYQTFFNSIETTISTIEFSQEYKTKQTFLRNTIENQQTDKLINNTISINFGGLVNDNIQNEHQTKPGVIIQFFLVKSDETKTVIPENFLNDLLKLYDFIPLYLENGYFVNVEVDRSTDRMNYACLEYHCFEKIWVENTEPVNE